MAASPDPAPAAGAGSRSRRKSLTQHPAANGTALSSKDGKSPRSRPGSRMENGVANGGGKHHYANGHGRNYDDDDDDDDDNGGKGAHHEVDRLTLWNWALIALLAYISYATIPEGFVGSMLGGGVSGEGGRATLQHVWYFGWITALSTGLGTLPFVVVSEMNKWWLGVSNAAAAGMMLAASASLVYEGITVDEVGHIAAQTWLGVIPQSIRVLIGILGGLLFIVSTKRLLDEHEEIKIAGLDGLDSRKVLLLIFVMTLHSFTEGVGIGVSFGGEKGPKLGVFISLTLAVHNVPEGLAVALVLVPKRISKVKTALWSIFTSIPQPLMAVPAYLFVESFIPFLPIGLGFAAGAMLWVAVFELIADAYEDTNGSKAVTGGVCGAAFVGMMLLQGMIKDGV